MSNRRAAVIFTIAVALLFMSCGVREEVIKKEPIEKRLDAQRLFFTAKERLERGNLSEALYYFKRYLDTNPKGKTLFEALYHISEIYREEGRPTESLKYLLRIESTFPYSSEIAEIQFKILETLDLLKRYDEIIWRGERWMEDHPDDPHLEDLALILSRAYRERENRIDAFRDIMKLIERVEDRYKRLKLSGYLDSLIETGSLEELSTMEVYAKGDILTHIIIRKAELLLAEKDYKKARKMALIAQQSGIPERWKKRFESIINALKENMRFGSYTIGCLLPLSGKLSVYGREVLQGMELALEPFSKDRGPDIRLLIYDTEGEPEKASDGVKTLSKERDLLLIIGPLLSKNAIPASKEAQRLGIPIININQKDGVTDIGDKVFRNFLTPSLEISSLLRRCMFEYGFRRFAILYPQNGYGTYMMRIFQDMATQMGGLIKATISYDVNETDFTGIIKELVGLDTINDSWVKEMALRFKALEEEDTIFFLKENEPYPYVDFEAVFIPDIPRRVAMIAPQFPYNNIKDVVLLGTSLWQDEELLKIGAEYLQGAIFPSGFFPEKGEEKVGDFLKRYAENFNDRPGILASIGYDTISFIRHVIEKNPLINREDISEAFIKVDDYDGIYGRWKFNADGEVIRTPIILTIQGNSFDPLRD